MISLLFSEFCCHVHIQEADYFEKIIEFDKNKFVKRILKKLDRSDTFELMIRLKLISKMIFKLAKQYDSGSRHSSSLKLIKNNLIFNL